MLAYRERILLVDLDSTTSIITMTMNTQQWISAGIKKKLVGWVKISYNKRFGKIHILGKKTYTQ